MKLLLRFFICMVCYGIPLIALGQQRSIDTLRGRTAQELFGLATTNPGVPILKKTIKKAKEENNLTILLDSYYYMSFLVKDENKLLYNDSIIALKDDFSNTLHPANAYYSKGFYFFNKRNFSKATDNFIKANEYANRNYNEDIIFRSRHGLALLKKEIGDYEQALTLHKENYNFATSKDATFLSDAGCLELLFSIATVYSELKKYDSVSYYNTLGIKESLDLKNKKKYNDFVLNEAEVLFNERKYNRSMDSLHMVLPYYESSHDQASLSVTYYYLSKNHFRLKEDKKAIELLEKVDSLFQISKDTRPKTKIKETYSLLTSYYKDQNNLEKLTVYQEKTIDLIKKLHENELSLNRKIAYEYDIPLILANNKKIVDEFETKKKQTTLFVYLLIGVIISILIILFYLNSKRKVYKKRFEDLMNKNDGSSSLVKNNTEDKKSPKATLNIPDDVIRKILANLENFEKNNEFLNSKISIAILAKTIGTNPNYLSKTVNHFKQMSFSQYVNTLRIEHSVRALKKDKVYRKYTLKAIAAEFGFNNTESFSKAFYRETGIKPSFFMKNLEKSNV